MVNLETYPLSITISGKRLPIFRVETGTLITRKVNAH